MSETDASAACTSCGECTYEGEGQDLDELEVVDGENLSLEGIDGGLGVV